MFEIMFESWIKAKTAAAVVQGAASWVRVESWVLFLLSLKWKGN